MNTYQITATRMQRHVWPPEEVTRRIDAESLEKAREIFREAYPRSEWIITREELIYLGDTEGKGAEQEEPEAAQANALEETAEPAETPEEPEPEPAKTEQKPDARLLRELRQLASTLERQLEEKKCQWAEAERKLDKTRCQLAKAQEDAEVQAIRAERAEEEIIRLKAKLYDCMAAGA